MEASTLTCIHKLLNHITSVHVHCDERAERGPVLVAEISADQIRQIHEIRGTLLEVLRHAGGYGTIRGKK